MAAIYANVIAPSSAILLTPTLDWWKVHDAFNGQNFTTLITGNSSRVFPSYLTPRGKCESDPSWDQCPGGGYSTLLSLLRAYQTDGIDLETQIKLPVSKSYRKISSTLDFNEYVAENESLAVATTSHTSIALIAGLLWNHILEQKVGKDPKNTSGAPGGLTSPNVVINTSWARSLNLKTIYHYNVDNGTRDVTKIENLMDIFIKTDDEHDEDDDDYIPHHFVPPFNTATGRKLGNYTTDASKVESYINEISKTVAAILSLAIVDGMSRNALSLKMRLITKNLQNGSSQGIEEFWEPHPEEDGKPGSEVFDATDVDEPVSIDWEVYRYGWGYGRQSTAVYFAITALFIHVALVLVFGIYIAIFWVSGERPGKSRDTISEFVALALASPLIGDNASEVRRLANGEEEEDGGSELLTLPIKLGMNDENERVLVT
ncbi:hypothetical protein H9Q73_003522 [Fusarium xylarioides]|nr:hypothetical protein H9Q73_003522 [Fusarium xylarioides]